MQCSLEMLVHYDGRWITLPKENGHEKLSDRNNPCPQILCAGRDALKSRQKVLSWEQVYL